MVVMVEMAAAKVKVVCGFCKGKGWYWDTEYGTGKSFKAECWECGGEGYLLKTAYVGPSKSLKQ
jgi:DnaJ-class molecular chaperone